VSLQKEKPIGIVIYSREEMKIRREQGLSLDTIDDVTDEDYVLDDDDTRSESSNSDHDNAMDDLEDEIDDHTAEERDIITPVSASLPPISPVVPPSPVYYSERASPQVYGQQQVVPYYIQLQEQLLSQAALQNIAHTLK
jgi:hypothetical protein